MGEVKQKQRKRQRPFFGKVTKLTGSVDSLDGDWHVNFYDVRYFFLGIEIFSVAKEKVITKQS